MPCPNCNNISATWNDETNMCGHCGWDSNPDEKYCVCVVPAARNYVFLNQYHATRCIDCGGWISVHCGCGQCTARPSAPPPLETSILMGLQHTVATVMRDLQGRMAALERRCRSIETYTKVLKVRQKRNGGEQEPEQRATAAPYREPDYDDDDDYGDEEDDVRDDYVLDALEEKQDVPATGETRNVVNVVKGVTQEMLRDEAMVQDNAWKANYATYIQAKKDDGVFIHNWAGATKQPRKTQRKHKRKSKRTSHAGKAR